MRLTKLVVFSLVCLAGCSDEEVEGESSPTGEAQLPPAFHLDGSRYVPLRRNHGEKFVFRRPTDAPATHGEEADPATMNESELAAALTSLTVRDGIIYRVEPDIEQVRNARDKIVKGASAATLPLSDDEAEPVASSSEKYIIEPLNWSRNPNNLSHPMSTILQMNDNQSGGCTGVMIGRSTALSASHCFFDSQNFIPNFSWTFRPGADSADANAFPFGEYACYGVRIAGGGMNAPGGDYAVIDFHSAVDFNGGPAPCSASPGDLSGWMGVRVASNSTLTSSYVALYGYPLFDESTYPAIYGSVGRVTISGSDVLKYSMDAIGGHSGAPLFIMENGYAHVVGIHSGGTLDFNTPVNHGARVTALFDTRIDEWSTEF